MAVEPTFMPAQAPNVGPSDLMESANLAQNWMSQAANRANTQANTQETQAKTQQLQMMMPALVAKTQADQAVAQGTLASAVVQQNMRANAGAQMGPATQEFTDAMQLADWNARADALAQIQAKYSWLGQVPESKGLDQAIDNARVQAHQSAVLDMQLENQREIWGQRTQATMYGADQRLSGTMAGVQARVQGAEAMAEANGGRANATVQSALIREYGTAATQLEIEASKALDPNQAASLTQEAQKYRQKMEELNTPPAGAGASPGTGAPVRAPAATAASPNAAAASGAAPKSTVTTSPAAPVKVGSWDEAKALKPGTPYIGPDGIPYVRSSAPSS
jgi:hypothetical protein